MTCGSNCLTLLSMKKNINQAGLCMNKQKMLLGAGLVMLGVSGAQGASMMPTNPMGTMFAPWNTMPGMPGGFSPLNNGFTSGSPMGMSPFSMSPFGSNGSPWGSMPSTMMPWNAWSSSPGSVVPWGNQMPLGNFSNFSNNGSGNQMPWGGNNAGMGMPWGNNVTPWSSWTGNRNNRNNNNNRDAWSTMLLMQELNGQQSLPGFLPGMTGLPPLSGRPMMMAPPQIPANTMPVQPKPQNSFVVPPPPKSFNPFKTPVAPGQPEVPAVTPAAVQGFRNPFSDPMGVGVAAESGNTVPSFDPFANGGSVTGQQNQQNRLQFPDADSFFINE